MKKLLDLLTEEMGQAFAAAGYDAVLGKVGISNRPDLCEFQCNGAMAGAKQYHKAPIMIANEVAAKLAERKASVAAGAQSPTSGAASVAAGAQSPASGAASAAAVALNPFSEAVAVAPGFLNLKLNKAFLKSYLEEMAAAPKFGMAEPEKAKTIVIDYGGANVAKPLHVGHLRSAVIGESVKRINRYAGHKVIGDAHLGDWGLQMGLVIVGLKERYPDWVYFDESYEGEYPEVAPFDISELEEIYPASSKRSKEDAEYKAKAMEATFKFQQGVRGYWALGQKIREVSIKDLRKVYESLNVRFELWNGESSIKDLIPEMVQYMKDGGWAYVSDGALVVDVKEETDTKEVPPCMILKSDGASLYNTTDLATILDRVRNYEPDQIIYLTDKRQDLYFDQVFRCARKTKLVKPETELTWIGFGTVNGADGKPFKTRDGGVMRLENLIADTKAEMFKKILEGREMSEEEAKAVADQVAIAALIYGDLSNQASKDYIFDLDRFTSFEGDTGPYLLYTIVRIKSILAKYAEQGGDAAAAKLGEAQSDSEKDLMMQLAQFGAMMEGAAKELAPHRVCAYVYDLANDFNRFYHETKIITEEDEAKKAGWIALLALTKDVMIDCITVLGFEAPEKM
ncbi:MAG: arginine--tRNA ligase [Lachnospiraceae bacterium]|nr:arginine--tRNA ligase [Lachnospiraceae bacterium]